MFSYLSLLIEEDIFKKIEVFFLIVGHTHASIDQYFSILARDIYKSKFIASPLALESLLAREDSRLLSEKSAKAKTKQKPLLVKKLRLVHDFKSALEPLINPNIKYYPIPHK